MKYLIVYAHPNPKSFNHAVKERVEAALKKQGEKYSVRDLYLLKWNPVLGGADFNVSGKEKTPEDIKTEQQYIKEADVLIVIHPIWWFGMPAVLKGYIDRVFSAGFAYEYGPQGIKGLLSGKKVMIINTTGAPQENYLKLGFKDALTKLFKDGTYEFCGMNVVAHKFLYAVPAISPEARVKMLEEIDGLEF
ncbi:MAG: NAD(P)H-dependent oxidoreductase [Candidatus Omnitrophica bacterium]|nr:NAD(P)H-dependent oxidoreductase [Candidatus Omnitrophota bacterium]